MGPSQLNTLRFWLRCPSLQHSLAMENPWITPMKSPINDGWSMLIMIFPEEEKHISFGIMYPFWTDPCICCQFTWSGVFHVESSGLIDTFLQSIYHECAVHLPIYDIIWPFRPRIVSTITCTNSIRWHFSPRIFLFNYPPKSTTNHLSM